MSGELKKMLIEAHKKADYSDGVSGRFELMFNPNGYTKKYELKYEEAQGAGSTGSPQVFGRIKPQDYTFDFLFDGTNTAMNAIDVHQRVEDFLTLTGKHDGEIHRPKYLKLSWGKLIVKCVLKSAEVTFSLFKPDGSPLRAKIKATFSENIEETLRVAKERENSPDLTHTRMFKEGDNLPLKVYEIYNSPEYYLQVAKVNNLNSIRNLKSGTELRFPPVSKDS